MVGEEHGKVTSMGPEGFCVMKQNILESVNPQDACSAQGLEPNWLRICSFHKMFMHSDIMMLIFTSWFSQMATVSRFT